MKGTLLLCFVHGFKGGDDAFHDFPKDLQKYIADEAKDLNVQCAAFPVDEPPGELAASAKAFRDWLDSQVSEQEKQTDNGSVGVVLVGHSTGGLVATDAFLSILNQQPNSSSSEPQKIQPTIHGIITFDTPFMGLSRSMFAYGSFAQYRVVTNAYSQLSAVGQLATFGSQTYAEVARAKKEEKTDAPEGWRAWQEAAMRTGAATGAASVLSGIYNYHETLSTGLSYLSRDSISKGWSSLSRENAAAAYEGINVDNMDKGLAYMSQENVGHGLAWISVHLQFVAALMRGEELTARLERMSDVKGVGFKNLYTSLGPNDKWSGSYFVAERTFCSIPEDGTQARGCFQKEINIKAKDEISAHISVFDPTKNSSYEGMTKMVAKLLVKWKDEYDGSCVDHYRIQKEKEAWDKNEGLHKYKLNETGEVREEGVAVEGADVAAGNYWGWPSYQSVTSYLPGVPFYSSTAAPAPAVESAEDTNAAPNTQAEEPSTDASSYHSFTSYLPGIPFYSTASATTTKAEPAEKTEEEGTDAASKEPAEALEEKKQEVKVKADEGSERTGQKVEEEKDAEGGEEKGAEGGEEKDAEGGEVKDAEGGEGKDAEGGEGKGAEGGEDKNAEGEGDGEQLTYPAGKVDNSGNVVNEEGEVIGRVSDSNKDNIEKLAGKIVDEDGDILDEEGNVLGTAVPTGDVAGQEPDQAAEKEAGEEADKEIPADPKPETTDGTPAESVAEASPEDTETEKSNAAAATADKEPKSESKDSEEAPVSYARSLVRYFWSDSAGLRETKVSEKNEGSGEDEGEKDTSQDKRDDEIEVDMAQASIPGVTGDLKVK